MASAWGTSWGGAWGNAWGVRLPAKQRRGGMSYDQVLAATVDYRKQQKTLAELRRKKRRGRRAREREHLLLLGAGWPP